MVKGTYNPTKRRAFINIDPSPDRMSATETDENGWEWELDYRGKRVGVFIPDLDLNIRRESAEDRWKIETILNKQLNMAFPPSDFELIMALEAGGYKIVPIESDMESPQEGDPLEDDTGEPAYGDPKKEAPKMGCTCDGEPGINPYCLVHGD